MHLFGRCAKLPKIEQWTLITAERELLANFQRHGFGGALARTTDLSVRQIHKELKGNVGRGVVGEIVKKARKEATFR